MSIDYSREEAQAPLITTTLTRDDEGEGSLRPRTLTEYIGQKKAKENLSVFIDAARLRNEPLDHVLLHGPPGLGKTTLSGIIANEMGVNIRVTSGPAIEKPGDLAALLTNLSENDILFVDEIHRLNRQVEEILYPAMEDYAIDIIIGKGPSANSIRLDLPRFTLIGATTRAGQLSAPLRDRFGVILRLELYTPEELGLIVTRSAGILNVPIEPEGAAEIAKRSRGTPRIANRLLRRVRIQIVGQAQRFVQRDGAVQRGVTPRGSRLDRVQDLVVHADVHVGPERRAALRIEGLHRLEQADHAFLDDVVLIAAQHEILLRGAPHRVFIAGKQNVGRSRIAAAGQEHQFHIVFLVVLAHPYSLA